MCSYTKVMLYGDECSIAYLTNSNLHPKCTLHMHMKSKCSSNEGLNKDVRL